MIEHFLQAHHLPGLSSWLLSRQSVTCCGSTGSAPLLFPGFDLPVIAVERQPQGNSSGRHHLLGRDHFSALGGRQNTRPWCCFCCLRVCCFVPLYLAGSASTYRTRHYRRHIARYRSRLADQTRRLLCQASSGWFLLAISPRWKSPAVPTLPLFGDGSSRRGSGDGWRMRVGFDLLSAATAATFYLPTIASRPPSGCRAPPYLVGFIFCLPRRCLPPGPPRTGLPSGPSKLVPQFRISFSFYHFIATFAVQATRASRSRTPGVPACACVVKAARGLAYHGCASYSSWGGWAGRAFLGSVRFPSNPTASRLPPTGATRRRSNAAFQRWYTVIFWFWARSSFAGASFRARFSKATLSYMTPNFLVAVALPHPFPAFYNPRLFHSGTGAGHLHFHLPILHAFS